MTTNNFKVVEMDELNQIYPISEDINHQCVCIKAQKPSHLFIETNLIAPNDMHHHHQISGGNEPLRPLERQQDIILHLLSKRPITHHGRRKIAHRVDEVGQHRPSPHRHRRRPPFPRRHGSLDLEHHPMPGVGERNLTQSVKHSEHRVGGRGVLVGVVDVSSGAAAEAGRPGDGGVAEGHDGGGEGDGGDGGEVGKLGEEELDGAEDGNPVGLSEGGASRAGRLHEFLQALAAGDHVDDVAPNLDDQLLGEHHPEAQLGAEGVLPELVVPVEPHPRDGFVEVDHLPHGVEGHTP